MSARRNDVRAILLMLAASLLWPAVEQAEASLIPGHRPFQVVFLRYVAQLVLVLAVVMPFTGVAALRTRRPWLQLMRGVFMFGMPACFLVGLEYASASWLWSVFWTMPLVAVISWAFAARERLDRPAAAAALAGALGAAAILGGSGSLIGTVSGLVMCANVAGYMVLTRILRGEHIAATLFYTALGAALPTALLVWRVWTPVLPSELIAIVGLGVISAVLLGAFDLSLASGSVAVAVPVLTLVPVWEAGLAIPLRGELPGVRQWVGIALIVTALAVWLAVRLGITARDAGEQVHDGSLGEPDVA